MRRNITMIRSAVERVTTSKSADKNGRGQKRRLLSSAIFVHYFPGYAQR